VQKEAYSKCVNAVIEKIQESDIKDRGMLEIKTE
jgi:hypothetical protein